VWVTRCPIAEAEMAQLVAMLEDAGLVEVEDQRVGRPTG